MDTIIIKDLEFWTRIGINEQERSKELRMLVTVTMHLDVNQAAKTDDLTQTIDYRTVASDILALRTTERQLIERLAEDIASMILEKHSLAQKVEVTLKKFVIPGTEYVELNIERTR